MVLFNNLLSRWSDYYVTSPYNINIHIVQRTRDQNGQIDQPEAFIFIYSPSAESRKFWFMAHSRGTAETCHVLIFDY